MGFLQSVFERFIPDNILFAEALEAHCEGTAGGTNDTVLTTLSDGGLSAGVQTENSYWNDAMSIGCTFGSKWYFYTDEEIAEQNGLATGMLREDYAKLVEESGSMMDMLAVNTETGENVNITLQRLSLTDALVLDEQKYAEISAEPLVEALEQTGLENVSTSVDEVEFLGEKHPCVRVKTRKLNEEYARFAVKHLIDDLKKKYRRNKEHDDGCARRRRYHRLQQRQSRKNIVDVRSFARRFDGDTLRVHAKVIEGDRERIQVYEGVCIARKNDGLNST